MFTIMVGFSIIFCVEKDKLILLFSVYSYFCRYRGTTTHKDLSWHRT